MIINRRELKRNAKQVLRKTYSMALIDMKKLFCLSTCSLIVFTLLAGCSAHEKESIETLLTPDDKAEMPVDAPTDNTPDIQTKASIETFKSGDSTIEYVVVTGLPDITIQEELNDRLKGFFTTILIRIEHENKTMTATAEYALIGNRYLSVRSYGTEYAKDTAYPVNTLRTEIFDIETGKPAGFLSDFVKIGMDLKLAITSEEFIKTYPETPIDGAVDVLAAEMVDNAVEEEDRFYLTEKGVGLYVTDRIHAEGDYWTFEANYTDIEHLLTQNLLDALDR